jgi:hypothetical protein
MYRLHSPWIKPMKSSSDSIGNQCHNLPVCRAVLQPNAPPHTPYVCGICCNMAVKVIESFFLLNSCSRNESFLLCY